MHSMMSTWFHYNNTLLILQGCITGTPKSYKIKYIMCVQEESQWVTGCEFVVVSGLHFYTSALDVS